MACTGTVGKGRRLTMAQPTIPVMAPRLPDTAALVPYLEEIDGNRWYSNFGPLQRRFETRLADHFDLPKAGVVCVGNCTAGLMLALMAVAPGRGGYCIMPSFTFVASAHAALAAGLVPLFIDVDPQSWTVTQAGVTEAIRSADRPVAAALVVSPFGAPVDVAAWDDFAEDRGIPVVIDAAAGFDGAVAGKSSVVISFHATKVIGTGEGGVVLSRDTALIELDCRGHEFRISRQSRGESCWLQWQAQRVQRRGWSCRFGCLAQDTQGTDASHSALLRRLGRGRQYRRLAGIWRRLGQLDLQYRLRPPGRG